ncbi:MAG: hypothetical protein R6U32_03515 [Candidatus Woesearchaeota archaeon]
MAIDNKCIEAHRVYGDELMEITLHRDDCIIDLHVLFEDFISYRDRLFGEEDFRRQEVSESKATYFLTFRNLAEAFLGRYRPDTFADFLENHMDMSDLQNEALVRRTRQAADHHGIAVCLPVMKNIRSGNEFFQLALVNVNKDDVNPLLSKFMLNRGYGRERVRVGKSYESDAWQNDMDLTVPLHYNRFRQVEEALRNNNIIIAGYRNGPDLSYRRIAEFYDLEDRMRVDMGLDLMRSLRCY